MFVYFVKKAVTQDDVERYGTDRIFYGLGTVDDDELDTQGEVMDFEESWKKTQFWHKNGGEILFEHSNKPVGRSLEVARKPHNGSEAILIKGMVKSGNPFFDAIWQATQGLHPTVKLNGMSMGGLRKAHRIDCTETECHKHWHQFDILEYSMVLDPSKKSALILGTYAKSNGYTEIINDPMPHWEEIYKGEYNMTGKENDKDKGNKKTKDCADVPPNEADLKKGADPKNPTEPVKDLTLDMEKLEKGITTLVQTEIKTSLEEFSKTFGAEIGKTFSEYLTNFNSQIGELKKMVENGEDKEKEAEKKEDKEKEKDKKEDNMEKGKPNDQIKPVFSLGDYIKIGQTPQPPAFADMRATGMKKSAINGQKSWGWRDEIKKQAKIL